MSTDLTRKRSPPRRIPTRRNSMVFPRALRDAISPLHDGRILELDAINGDASTTAIYGSQVELKLVVKETGKLAGSFVVLMRLQPDAARQLAATLTELADRAVKQP
jgi:hypothetical protein